VQIESTSPAARQHPHLPARGSREVAVSPPEAFAARRRLFQALEQLFPVRFVAAEGQRSRGLDAQILLAPPSNEQPADSPIPTLVFAPDQAPGRPELLDVSTSPLVDARLRGLRLPGECAQSELPPPVDSVSVLATTHAGDRPAWTTDPAGSRQAVAVQLPELADGETLRDRFTRGCWLGGVALVQFLRTVCAELLPTPPPLRATIIVDDPNLRWYRYGRIDYRTLIAHAKRVDYHVAVAAIPLDLRFSHPGVVRLFDENQQRLSLAIHGNNHAHRELADLPTDDPSVANLAQALRRVAAFEQHSGLTVSRVLAPPHEACGRRAMDALVQLGFESATLSRAFSWIPPGAVPSVYADPDDGQRFTGFAPAEVLANGLPVIIRRDFGVVDEAPLVAFLDQPLVFYGHEAEFGDHLTLIESVADSVNRLGTVQWSDLRTISRSNFSTFQDGETLVIRPSARRIEVQVPAGASRLVIEPLVHTPTGADVEIERVGEGALVLGDSERSTITLRPDAATPVELTLRAANAVDPETVPGPRLPATTVLRRLVTEGRDRLHMGR
jgi:hypothetical protein